MSPAISVDNEVFEELQKHAEPLLDTPNSVLRRILGLRGTVHATPGTGNGGGGADGGAARTSRQREAKPATKRARPGTVLPEGEYELPILAILVEKGGRAPMREVVDELGERLNRRLTSTDREPLTSGEIRWRNRAQFVRLKLIERGEMEKGPHGVWQISDQGRKRLEAEREPSRH